MNPNFDPTIILADTFLRILVLEGLKALIWVTVAWIAAAIFVKLHADE